MMIGMEEIKETLLALLDMTASEEVVNKIADTYQAYFQALQARGFTRDEALLILSKIPIGSTGPQK